MTLGEEVIHKADSVIFLEEPSYSSLAKPTRRPVFHWATDYETDEESPIFHGLHRVMKSMASGLSQRRYLGFPDHYIFGMAQHGNRLEILAGNWVLKRRILRIQETAQEQTELPLQDIPEAQTEGAKGFITVPTSGDVERPSKRLDVCKDTSAEIVPKEDDYQVRSKIFRSAP